MNWYYLSDRQQYGPIDGIELHRRARDGRLRPTDLVWTESMGSQWVSASSIEGLFPPEYEGSAFTRRRGTGGATPNVDLMARARASLTGNWGIAVGVTLVYSLIIGVSSNICGIIPLIIDGPFMLGLAIFFLCVGRRSGPQFGQLFEGFSNFGTALGAYLLMMIFITLWSLLLIVPGIIAAYAYSMTFYIIADDPDIGALEAIRRSKEMMRGKKGKLFCMHLRFIGWWLLCILTCGIGFLWLMPYIQTATVHFYDDLAPAAPSSGQALPAAHWRTQGSTPAS